MNVYGLHKKEKIKRHRKKLNSKLNLKQQKIKIK